MEVAKLTSFVDVRMISIHGWFDACGEFGIRVCFIFVWIVLCKLSFEDSVKLLAHRRYNDRKLNPCTEVL